MSETPSGQPNTAGPPNARRDRRIVEIIERLTSWPNLMATITEPVQDAYRTLALENLQRNKHLRSVSGMVVYALPFAGWYRVQLGHGRGSISCTLGDSSGFLPLGPKTATVLPPGSAVMVMLPEDRPHGIIVAAYPGQQTTSRFMLPDWIVQGSQTGQKRETVYRHVLENTVVPKGSDFSAGRPLDITSLDWGKVTELGGALHVDPFLLYMRISEMCGLWLNYWDQAVRLAGMQLDIQNPAFEINARNDEGEPFFLDQHNPYLWEGLGMYKPGEQIHAEFEDEPVQTRIARGKIDLVEGEEDVQSISRYQEFGGYLGQGRKRIVMVPAKIEGVRYYSDDPTTAPDMGVFEETIALDGSYLLRSAKQVMLLKHTLIPVPKRMRLAEDQKEGDDARKDNYKFAGTFGEAGKPHKVSDIDNAKLGENRHLLTTAGVADLIAYNFNWKGLHPFHYHTNDYKVPEESDLKNLPRAAGKLTKAQEVLNFSDLAYRHSMQAPTPQAVKVDDRYGEVDYYQRTAGVALLEDGGITIFDGYGASITLAGGHVRIDAPGDVVLSSGRNIVAMGGDDIVLRAKQSLDATAGSGDLRLKAEYNLQILGGNSGVSGGILLESKAAGFLANFEGNTGEAVRSGGIMLKAPHSAIVNWCGDYYVRTGSEGSDAGKLNKGSIIFDAAKGDRTITFKGSLITSYASSGVAHYIGPSGSNSRVKAAYAFGAGGVLFSEDLSVDGDIFAIAGNVITNEHVFARTGVSSVSGGVYVTEIKADDLQKSVADGRQMVRQQLASSQTGHESLFTKGLYKSGNMGNDRTIDYAAFSFRDDKSQQQYNTQDYLIVESRWQQMARLGIEGGYGTAWEEPTVVYHGDKQLPYPGYINWTSETMLRLNSLQFFDTKAGVSKPRTDAAYETPSYAEAKKVKPVEEYKTIK